jgi:hypothetical protein
LARAQRRKNQTEVPEKPGALFAMLTITIVLLVLAALCFFGAACNVRSTVNLIGLGLFLCVLAWLLGGR